MNQTTTRIHRAVRLENAIARMARRYGVSCLQEGMAALDPDRKAELDRAHRAASRQYAAMLRLTGALADLVLDGAR